MARPEGEPTTQIIFHSGRNGALQPEFAGVEDDSVFDGSEYVPRNKAEIEATIRDQTLKPTGGVVGGTGGSVFDPETLQYVPTEELKP